MSTRAPKLSRKAMYDKEASDYCRSLPLEHFMESIAQATQRKISVSSLELVAASRDDVHVFSELLVQYPVRGKARTGKVVPDNMVVISSEPIEATTSYNVPLEPAEPFWVMEYVSAGNARKDYVDSFNKYEKKLKVPYYLVFHPEEGKLNLWKHDGTRYVPVLPNRHGRYAVPELEIEVGLLDGWVRFWYQGKLLPLPAELHRDLESARQQMAELQRAVEEEKRRAEEEKRRADDLQDRLMAMEREIAALRSGRRNGNGRGNPGSQETGP